jgi:hypothetical protein
LLILHQYQRLSPLLLHVFMSYIVSLACLESYFLAYLQLSQV